MAAIDHVNPEQRKLLDQHTTSVEAAAAYERNNLNTDWGSDYLGQADYDDYDSDGGDGG